MVKLRDVVSYFKNNKNNQEKLEIKKLKLKEHDLDVDDLLDISIRRKLKRFKEGKSG